MAHFASKSRLPTKKLAVIHITASFAIIFNERAMFSVRAPYRPDDTEDASLPPYSYHLERLP